MGWRRGLFVLRWLFVFAVSWYLMQAIHELGHIVHAVATGGTVTSVEMPLLGISCTHVNPNPEPVIVAWGGAIWGVGLPFLVIHVLLEAMGRQTFFRSALMFFLGFCCLANGLYLGIGAVKPVGDAADLLNAGVQWYWLLAYGVPVSLYGLYVWHCGVEQDRLIRNQL